MRLYGSSLYGTTLYNANLEYGTWENEYSFTYIEGATVNLTIDTLMTVPDGTSIKIYAGETIAKLQEIEIGVQTAVVYDETISGSAPLFVKAVLYRNNAGATSPELLELVITIDQTVSLYTIASSVLRDASLLYGTNWNIDTYLQTIEVPYSIFNNVTHYQAMQQILEASGAYMYQSRTGDLMIVYPNDFNGASCLTINSNDSVYDLENRSQEVTNRCIISVKPLVALTATDVWQNDRPIVVQNGETRVVEMRVTDYPAIIDGSASAVPDIIDSVEYLSWGARVTITGTADDQSVILTLNAKPLVVQGETIIDYDDTPSIRLNGEKVLSITNNSLMQEPDVCEAIAIDIVNRNKDARRDADITWRGNPALEVGDCVLLDNVKHSVQNSEISFNGTLRVKQRLRRVI